TRELAAVGDAGDDALGDVDVELRSRVVVEEEQRLRALDEHVVDAHRDEVDADLVVCVVLYRELDLRADAVGARNEHGIAKTFRHAEERTEAAQAADDLGTHRSLHGRLDALDELVARVDV